MKREDIQYFNSWAKSFRKATPAQVMQAIINGIWISSNKDPEDIYLVFPKLIVKTYREIAEVDKDFGLCPFEFSIEDSETWEWEKAGEKHASKGRDINMFGINWHLDKYEMRKAVTKTGLELAKRYKITKDEVIALHKKYSWDDEAAYKELIANRHDLTIKSKHSDYTYPAIRECDYKYIRAAFIPHCDTLYSWMDAPEKASIVYAKKIED